MKSLLLQDRVVIHTGVATVCFMCLLLQNPVQRWHLSATLLCGSCISKGSCHT
jgi:hypothetical protein